MSQRDGRAPTTKCELCTRHWCTHQLVQDVCNGFDRGVLAFHCFGTPAIIYKRSRLLGCDDHLYNRQRPPSQLSFCDTDIFNVPLICFALHKQPTNPRKKPIFFPPFLSLQFLFPLTRLLSSAFPFYFPDAPKPRYPRQIRKEWKRGSKGLARQACWADAQRSNRTTTWRPRIQR